MHSATLEGRHHCEVGAVELIGEGPCAIAISRGGATKTYSHTEPNEDACMFVVGPGGALVAVADGHRGATGSEIALRYLLDHKARDWTRANAGSLDALIGEADQALTAIHHTILAEAERCDLPPSPSTLCLALVRPGEDLLVHASVGDSHIFCTRDRSAPIDLAWAAHHAEARAYLGQPSTPQSELMRRVARESLAGVRSLVLVTDGFSEAGIGHLAPQTELNAIQSRSLLCKADLRAVETCRGVVESALAIQRKNRAGDNLACAVWVPN